MASSYPNGLDALPTITQTTAMNDPGFEADVVITNIADAVEAVQGELGTAPSGSFATVKDRLDFSEPVLVLDNNEAVPGATPVNTVILRRSATGGGGDHNALQNLTVGNPHTQYAGRFMPPIISGYWHAPQTYVGGASDQFAFADRLWIVPFYFPMAVSISAVGIEVTTAAGAVGSIVRMGLYTLDPMTRWASGAALADGTASTETTGAKTITFGTPVAVPALSWIGVAVITGGDGTATRYRAHTSMFRVPRFTTLDASFLNQQAMYYGSQNGNNALPSLSGGPVVEADGIHSVAVKMTVT